LDVNRWIYDARRGLPRDTRNPAVQNPKRNNMPITKKNNDLVAEVWNSPSKNKLQEASEEDEGERGGGSEDDDDDDNESRKSSISSEKMVPKTLFNPLTDNSAPNLYEELMERFDRHALFRMCKQCGIFNIRGKKSKYLLIKRLLEYCNQKNLSIYEVADRKFTDGRVSPTSTTPSSLGNSCTSRSCHKSTLTDETGASNRLIVRESYNFYIFGCVNNLLSIHF